MNIFVKDYDIDDIDEDDYSEVQKIAKETAENMLKKIENEYKLGSDQNLREWIYGGVDRINGILETVMKFKNGGQILETIAKKIKK